MNEEDKIELRSEDFQEVLGSVPNWILRWGLTILAAFVILLLIGSFIIKYPDIITSKVILTGSIPPASITARSTGKLNELYVSNNQLVKAGDYLGVIDNPANTEDIKFLKSYIEQLNINNRDNPIVLPEKSLNVGSIQPLWSSLYTFLFEYQEYLRLLYYPQKKEITNQRILQYEQQYQNLLKQKKIVEEQLNLHRTQFQRDSVLLIKGIISLEDLESSKNLYLQSSLNRENTYSSLDAMQIQIAQLRETLLDTSYIDIEKMNNLRSQIHSLISQISTEIQSWELTYVIKAPINGEISFTKFWTIYQNITSGEEVFNIIPTSDFQMIGKAYIPIVRSGKVQIGQKVNIKLDNFPENEYGTINGIVKNISLVPVISEESATYVVEIDLPEKLITTYHIELPYLPNTQGQANIITQDLSLFNRFFSPIKKIFKEKTLV